MLIVSLLHSVINPPSPAATNSVSVFINAAAFEASIGRPEHPSLIGVGAKATAMPAFAYNTIGMDADVVKYLSYVG